MWLIIRLNGNLYVTANSIYYFFCNNHILVLYYKRIRHGFNFNKEIKGNKEVGPLFSGPTVN